MRAQVLYDENDAGAMIGIRPAVQARRRMENMLDPMDDQWAQHVVGQGDNALDAQKIWPMRRTQHFQKEIASGKRQGNIADKTEGSDGFFVPISFRNCGSRRM